MRVTSTRKYEQQKKVRCKGTRAEGPRERIERQMEVMMALTS
jgi:hypothetical protein